MKFFQRQFKKFALYAGLPEMRLFWIFLPLVLIILVINFPYLPRVWFLTTAIAFFVLATIIFIVNLRLARSNLDIKLERNELTGIVSNLNIGVIAYDPNFKILIFNRAAEAIFSIRPEEVIGKVFDLEKAKGPNLKLLSQIIYPSLAPLVIKLSEVGVYPQIADFSFEEPKTELRVTTNKIIDSSGHLLGFVKLVHDRTREIAILRSKSEFITVAAHQLRTPSTAVYWALESLSKESLTPSQKELADTGFGAAGNLLKTINDLLDVSKIEEGRFGYQFENVNIISFLEEILGELMLLAKQSGIKLYFQKPEEPSIVLYVDPQKLKMVLFNLVDNAIKYNVPNGKVTVGLERVKDQPYIQISVKDTGIGIPPTQINKLFTKFFRAENATRAVPSGLGLGLYIIRNVIKRHGGEIRAESELNRGTTFYFTIPTNPKLIPPKEIIYGER
ncbi:MAG TPA: PAS domain-containing protein [Candidatus Wolfebacteria bacterium]|nr:PAS domain-containing protein [Candidatus Wolfebacteria bacterium]